MDTDTQANQVGETQEDLCISFDQFLTNVGAFFDEASTGVPVTVERGGQLFRLAVARRRGKKSKRHFSKDDALWDIVGMINSGGPGDIAENKYAYLADAYASLQESDGENGEQSPSAGSVSNSVAERQ